MEYHTIINPGYAYDPRCIMQTYHPCPYFATAGPLALICRPEGPLGTDFSESSLLFPLLSPSFLSNPFRLPILFPSLHILLLPQGPLTKSS